MAFLEWTDNLSVKIRIMDTDHKRLIDLINALFEASQVKEDGGAIAKMAMTNLLDFTKTHFIHEETLMRKSAYPQFIPHKIEHDRLMKQMIEFKERYAAGQVGLSNETIVFLRTWLCDHILKIDIHLGSWLNKHAEGLS